MKPTIDNMLYLAAALVAAYAVFRQLVWGY